MALDRQEVTETPGRESSEATATTAAEFSLLRGSTYPRYLSEYAEEGSCLLFALSVPGR